MSCLESEQKIMLERMDCFAYTRKNKQFKCSSLNVANCLNCKFYCTKEQYDKKMSIVPKIKKINGKVCVNRDTR